MRRPNFCFFLTVSSRLLLLVVMIGVAASAPIMTCAPAGSRRPRAIGADGARPYVAAPDSNFTWKVARELPADGVSAVLLDMTSQWLTEREVERPLWTHWITVVRPTTITSDVALLFISGGSLDRQPPARPARGWSTRRVIPAA